MTPEFNLLEEKWIRIIREDCKIEEVSLVEALINAHEYEDLSGEMPAQDVAVLRLMLAVLHTVFSRTDEDGEFSPLASVNQVKERWKTIWNLGKFPENPIKEYLEKYKDRFWLFHEKRPFWQVPQAEKGTEYTSAKLNGELSESNNKIRLFTVCGGKGKKEMTYAEAARWILFVNGYDDVSIKNKEGKPSPGVGYLGKLGLITAVGKNLFETLMLNLTLLKDGVNMWGEGNNPVWELETPRSENRAKINVPNNQAELLTLQSRRLLLQPENGRVVKYHVLGGDFFDSTGALVEQMTVWREQKAKKGMVKYKPRPHSSSRQMWRDFEAMFSGQPDDANSHIPGVVSWYKTVAEMMEWSSGTLARFRIVSIQYGTKASSIDDTFSDSVTFSSALLSAMGSGWQMKIVTEIKNCETLAKAVGTFAEDLAKAAGDEKSNKPKRAEEQLYDRLDLPFRMWLREIDPNADPIEDSDDIIKKWQKQAKDIAMDLGEEMVEDCGEAAFVGRKAVDKKRDVVLHYSAPEAFIRFKNGVERIYHI